MAAETGAALNVRFKRGVRHVSAGLIQDGGVQWYPQTVLRGFAIILRPDHIYQLIILPNRTGIILPNEFLHRGIYAGGRLVKRIYPGYLNRRGAAAAWCYVIRGRLVGRAVRAMRIVKIIATGIAYIAGVRRYIVYLLKSSPYPALLALRFMKDVQAYQRKYRVAV